MDLDAEVNIGSDRLAHRADATNRLVHHAAVAHRRIFVAERREAHRGEALTDGPLRARGQLLARLADALDAVVGGDADEVPTPGKDAFDGLDFHSTPHPGGEVFGGNPLTPGLRAADASVTPGGEVLCGTPPNPRATSAPIRLPTS